jgi:hypothetical protein
MNMETYAIVGPIFEELDPELRPYVRYWPRPPFGKVLDHPLLRVNDLDAYFKDGRSNAELFNRRYRDKRAQLTAAIESRNWHSYVFLHERPYRLQAILDTIHDYEIAERDLWPLVAEVWRDNENIHQCLAKWRKLWSLSSPCRKLVMSNYERRKLAQLPAILTIWRGVSRRKAVHGLSWTLDRKKAEWFARQRSRGAGLLVHGRVRKRDVLAYFSRRNEREIVVFPQNLMGLRVVKLEGREPK